MTSPRDSAPSRTDTRLVWLIPLTIAAAYMVVFVAQLGGNLRALGWESDYSSTFLQAETLVSIGSGGYTVMASAGQWVPLWFGLLTARLPLHRELWMLAPTLLFLATAFTVGWSVSQVASRRAAVLAVLIGLIASPLALAFFMAEAHNTVYPCTALVGAYLTWLTRGERRRRLTAVCVPPLLGVAIGTCIASDFLVAATAAIPLALTAILAAVRRDHRSRLVSLSALTTVGVAIPISKLTSSTMTSLGFRTLPLPIKFATLSELPGRAELLFKGLKALFNGYLGPAAPGTLHTALGFANDVVMTSAIITVLAIGAYTAARFVSSDLRRYNTMPSSELAYSLHVVYWAISGITVCGAYWIGGEGPTTTHESYYGTVIFSLAAVIPLLLSTSASARWLLAGGTSIFFLGSLVAVTSQSINVAGRLERRSLTITRIAHADHLTVGYGNWADASALTWSTHERVIVRPVIGCPNTDGASLCPGFEDYVQSWYVPELRPTFLLIEAGGVDLDSVPTDLGQPVAVYAFESMKMYVYPYDIASRLGPLTE